MESIKFSWDEKKAASNKSKHGISFDEAKTVFLDEYARIIDDPDHSSSEERFIIWVKLFCKIIGRVSLLL